MNNQYKSQIHQLSLCTNSKANPPKVMESHAHKIASSSFFNQNEDQWQRQRHAKFWNAHVAGSPMSMPATSLRIVLLHPNGTNNSPYGTINSQFCQPAQNQIRDAPCNGIVLSCPLVPSTTPHTASVSLLKQKIAQRFIYSVGNLANTTIKIYRSTAIL